MPERDISSIFTDNLKKLLSKNNMSYKELAEKLGVKASSVSMWMTGNSLPRMGMLDKIADLFNVSVESLITNTEENEEIYYLNEETASMAQKIFEDKKLRMLFDAAKDADPEDLEAVHNMLLALKRKDRKED